MGEGEDPGKEKQPDGTMNTVTTGDNPAKKLARQLDFTGFSGDPPVSEVLPEHPQTQMAAQTVVALLPPSVARPIPPRVPHPAVRAVYVSLSPSSFFCIFRLFSIHQFSEGFFFFIMLPLAFL